MLESDTFQIAVSSRGEKKLIDVPVYFRIGSIVTHDGWGCSGFSVSTDCSGFSYYQGFDTKEQARKFAEYLATIPELVAVKCREDADQVPYKIVRRMNAKAADIISGSGHD